MLTVIECLCTALTRNGPELEAEQAEPPIESGCRDSAFGAGEGLGSRSQAWKRTGKCLVQAFPSWI